MDKKLLEKMRKILVDRRDKLVRTDDAIVDDAQGLLDNDQVDEGDRAQAAAASEVIAKLDDKDLRELNELNAAIQRIADGTYGLCEECDEEIPAARLEVLPEARRDAACAESLGRDRPVAAI